LSRKTKLQKTTILYLWWWDYVKAYHAVALQLSTELSKLLTLQQLIATASEIQMPSTAMHLNSIAAINYLVVSSKISLISCLRKCFMYADLHKAALFDCAK
jgi:hypothetical protein